MSGIYKGRLVCDGYGNLLADEGDRAGDPVAYHEGSFVFVGPDEPSHNERHHQNEVAVVGTSEENQSEPGNEHHLGPVADDPHAKGLRFNPDKRSAKASGHTESGKN